MRRRLMAMVLFGGLFVGCGGSGGSDAPDPNLVGPDAVQYQEAKEDTNSSRSSPEDTHYTLTANGIAISGSIEPGTGTIDYYLISSGEFSGMDVRVILNGKRLAEEAPDVVTTVELQQDAGYPPITGNDMVNVWVSPQMKYLVGLTPMLASGKAYQIQLRGH